MPKGVPLAGFRKRRSVEGDNVVTFSQAANLPAIYETDEEIEERLNNNFNVLELMSQAVCDGKTKSLIVSGAPGLGKSFTVEQVVERHGTVGYCKGFARPTGIYKLLHEYQYRGNVTVFDDCDSVFSDETSLNLLKAACDTLDKRRINWGSETNMLDAEGQKLPRNFEYEGAIIFITNLDFDALVASGNKLAPHLEALMSRSHYINMGMKTKRDYMVRIKQVVRNGLLSRNGLDKEAEENIMEFISNNVDKFRELSLRMVIKCGELYEAYPSKWQSIAKATLFRS